MQASYLQLNSQSCLHQSQRGLKEVQEGTIICEEVAAEQVLTGGSVQQQAVHAPEHGLHMGVCIKSWDILNLYAADMPVHSLLCAKVTLAAEISGMDKGLSGSGLLWPGMCNGNLNRRSVVNTGVCES